MNHSIRLAAMMVAPAWRDVDTDGVLQPKALGEIAGLPRYGEVLVLKKNPKPLWSPVTTEAALTLVRKQRQKEVASFEDGARRIRAGYDDWMNPAKKAAWEQKRSKDTEDARASSWRPTAIR